MNVRRYYRRYGDPGIGGFFKKAFKVVKKVATSPLGDLATLAIPGGGFLKGAKLLSKVGKVRAFAKAGKLAGMVGKLKGAGKMSAAMLKKLGIRGAGAAAAAVGAGVGGMALGSAFRGPGSPMGGEIPPWGMGEAISTVPMTIDPVTGMATARRRYRRMNPTNPKALNRAIRRVTSFKKLFSKSIRITSTVHRKAKSRGRVR